MSNLAHELGLGVTVEGIETTQQHDAVAGIGCEHAQGHLYSPALPASDVLSLLREGSGQRVAHGVAEVARSASMPPGSAA